MAIHLPLEKMSIEEKLQAMESLWENLSSQAERYQSPSWHGEILAEREAAIENGEDSFEDWEKAQVTIRKACCEPNDSR